MVLTLDGSQAGQHWWAGLRTGAAAEQTPPPVVGGRCLNCDLVLKILKTHINLKCRVRLAQMQSRSKDRSFKTFG